MEINSIFFLNVRKLRQKSNIDGVRLMKTVSDKHMTETPCLVKSIFTYPKYLTVKHHE